MRQVRQSIWEGSLWELVESRCRAHPRMLDGLRALSCQSRWLEELDPASKSTLFYLGPESAKRPEVIRYGSRLDRFELEGSVLVADPGTDDASFDHVFWFKPPFGPYPKELAETYPLNAEVPEEADPASVEQALENLKRLIAGNPKAEFALRLKSLPNIGPSLEEVVEVER